MAATCKGSSTGWIICKSWAWARSTSTRCSLRLRRTNTTRRQHEGQTVLVALNRSEETQEIRLPAGPASRYLDLLNGGQELLAQEGALTVELSPLWGRILLAA